MASRIPVPEIPDALEWERLREHYWRRLGHTSKADQICGICERLEQRLFSEGD